MAGHHAISGGNKRSANALAAPFPSHAPAARAHHPPDHRGRLGQRVHVNGAWWAWNNAASAWIVDRDGATCGRWGAPLTNASPELVTYAAGELAQNGYNPVAEVLADGKLYLFVSYSVAGEIGPYGIEIRPCAGAGGAELEEVLKPYEVSMLGDAGLASPPMIAPPSPVVFGQQPRGAAGIKHSAEWVRDGIDKDRRHALVIAWVRQTIHLAGLDGRAPDLTTPTELLVAFEKEIRRRASFVSDPHNIELVGGTVEVLCLDPNARDCWMGGDCDDLLRALGTALSCAGVRVRLKVRRYKNARLAHIFLEYDSSTYNTRGPWIAWDPTTKDGRVSSRPPTEEQTYPVAEIGPEDPGGFMAVGQPQGDVSMLGAPPAAQDTLPADQSAALLAVFSDVQSDLNASIALLIERRAALMAVRKDLGFPEFDTGGLEPPPATAHPLALYYATSTYTKETADAESKLIASATLIAQAMSDATAGKRGLYWDQGDLFIEALPGDATRILLVKDATTGAHVLQYFDPVTNQPANALGAIPIGVIVAICSVAAAAAIWKICDTIADTHKTDAQSKFLTAEQERPQTPEQRAATIAAASHVIGPAAAKSGFDPGDILYYLGIAALLVGGGIGGYFIIKALPSLTGKKREANAPRRMSAGDPPRWEVVQAFHGESGKVVSRHRTLSAAKRAAARRARGLSGGWSIWIRDAQNPERETPWYPGDYVPKAQTA